MDEDGHVTIGCDGLNLIDSSTILKCNDSKIIKMKSQHDDSASIDWYIGHGGSPRSAQIIESNLELISTDTPYIICEKIRSLLNEYGQGTITNNLNEHENMFIVCRKDMLFAIYREYSYLLPTDNFIAIGAAGETCLASLETMRRCDNPGTDLFKVETALRITAKYDAYTTLPIQIWNTRGEYKVIES
jgi:ATP-dependent protease HslVU (ClpYQ) peptidase subunit